MEWKLCKWLVIVILFSASAVANEYRLEIKVTKKMLEKEKAETLSRQVSSTEYAYQVTMQNRTFKDLDDLKVEYVIYGEQDVPGTDKEKEKTQSGTENIEKLANNKKTTFMTEAIILDRAQLKANWRYGDGSSGRASANMKGIWIRVYDDDQLVHEYSLPRSRARKGDWDADFR